MGARDKEATYQILMQLYNIERFIVYAHILSKHIDDVTSKVGQPTTQLL